MSPSARFSGWAMAYACRSVATAGLRLVKARRLPAVQVAEEAALKLGHFVGRAGRRLAPGRRAQAAQHGAGDARRPPGLRALGEVAGEQIGRASCRERV